MKTLFTNGCSWTYGGGLDGFKHIRAKLHRVVWPYHLKEIMGFDKYINLAMGGASNQRIFRTTLDWIVEQDAETLKSTTAVIQWTQRSRKEFYIPQDIKNENPSDQDKMRWMMASIYGAHSPIPTSKAFKTTDPAILGYYDQEIHTGNKCIYKTYTEIEGIYNHMAYCAALANLFDHYGVEYYYWDFVNIDPLIPNNFLTHLLESYPWLEKDTIRHEWDYERLTDDKGQYGIEGDSHPSLLGHKQLAEHIKRAIENVKN